MFKNLNEKQLFVLQFIAFTLVAILTVKVSAFAKLYGALFFLGAVLVTIKTRNKGGIAHLTAGYLMAAEVFFRMTYCGLPWEFGKLSIIVLLLLGLVFDGKKRGYPLYIIVYFLLLLPAIVTPIMNDAVTLMALKGKLMFNMTGPAVVLVSTLYFYKYKMTMEEFVKLSRWILFGIITMSVYVLFKIGDYSAIHFTYSSNSDASGGFSGNQVSIAFGIGIMVLAVNLVLNNRVLYWLWLELLLVFTFTFQGLMTFSRGGLLSAILAILAGVIYYYFSNVEKIILFFKKNIVKMILGSFLLVGTFYYVNEVTGGFLYARYFNVNSEGKQVKKDITTGRGDIFAADVDLMVDTDYVGAGVGMAISERKSHRGFAAHIEYSRMMAEHGVLGILAIIMILLMPIQYFFTILNRPDMQMIFIPFMTIALLTMTHAAMRLGMVGFFYGLAYIYILKKSHDDA